MPYRMILLFLFSFCYVIAPIQAAESHDELFVWIGEAMMETKEGHWNNIIESMEQFQEQWESLKDTESDEANKVSQALENVKKALKKEEKDIEKIQALLTSLSTALVQYDAYRNPVDSEKEKEKIKQLLVPLNEINESVESGNFKETNLQYQALLKKWNKNETIVRQGSVVLYGEIEKQMAFLRIAITQQPPNQEGALQSIKDLKMAIQNFVTGKADTNQKTEQAYSLSDLAALLEESEKSIQQQDKQRASEKLNELLSIWPLVEGEVLTRDGKLYNDMETEVPTAVSLLNSQNADMEKAQTIVKELQQRLLPLMKKNSYTAWDAALILLREGLEALLIITALMAFLKKTNHADKQKWIWAGVAAGVFASAILSMVIHIVFSQATAASSREYMEGITGIAAVVMMLTVAAWLHNKANTQNWVQYIHKNMGQAIAKGSLFSMAFISFLSIFREGAETIIFYAGMAPSMSLQQLLLGIGLALAILLVIGFAIIRFSIKIPIRPFFMVATLFLYFLSFKILGVSIHALQIADVLPIHPVSSFPFIGFLGLYPSWEGLIPQLAWLGIIAATTFWIEKTNKKEQPGHDSAEIGDIR